MTKNEALALLTARHFRTWNQYRKANPAWIPDLTGLDLSQIDFTAGDETPDLSGALLFGTILGGKSLFEWQGRRVKLEGALFDSTTQAGFDPAQYGGVFVTQEYQARLGTAKQSKVFISYAWANQDVVIAIDQWLRRKGLAVAIDRRDFFAGSRIRDEILRMMKDSNVVLIFYSKESRDKPWTQFEQELAADLEMTAKKEGVMPPRIIYVVIDDTPLPNITESNKIAIMAKGKRFELVCEEIYHNIMQLPRASDSVDLTKWSDYVF